MNPSLAHNRQNASANKAVRQGDGQRNMAEAVRFELTEEFPLRRFSRPLHSTALPRFRRLRAAILPERNTLSNSAYWLFIRLCYDRA